MQIFVSILCQIAGHCALAVIHFDHHLDRGADFMTSRRRRLRLGGKGKSAERTVRSVWNGRSWDNAEYALYCHRKVERYQR